MGLTKGLSDKSLSSSLSAVHILYNQALVDGLSVSYVPAKWIDNIQLDGGSTHPLAKTAHRSLLCCLCAYLPGTVGHLDCSSICHPV